MLCFRESLLTFSPQSTGNALVGLGVMLYDDRMIRPPSALRRLTPLVVQNRLNDWGAVSLAVKQGRDTGDDLLARYENCWWCPFNEKGTLEGFRQSPIDIIRAWQLQKKHLPAPLSLPSRGMVSLQGLSEDELDRTYLIGTDMQKTLDREIAVTQSIVADITALLVKCHANVRDLQDAEERALEAEQLKAMVSKGRETVPE